VDPELVEAIRAQTPGVGHANHLAACGSALMSQPVIDAVTSHLELEGRIGGYAAQAEKADELDVIYGAVARLINAEPDEIAVVENATAAWCQAFYSLEFQPGDRILTSEAEYGANYVAFLQRRQRDGIVIDVVPSDPAGTLDVDALETMIDGRVKLIATTWIPTNGGLVNPAAQIGRVARNNGVLSLLDACQAVGQMPVDVAELQCDFLTGTGRKFLRGPRGTGFLYVRRGVLDDLEPVMIDHFAAPWVATDRYELRSDARRFENWENAYALRAGLRAAVLDALDLGLDAIQDRTWSLAEQLRERLRELPTTHVRDIGETNCAIVGFTIDGLDPYDAVARLADERIIIDAVDPSSTLIDSQRRSLPTLLRAAPHYYNTESELEALVAAIQRLP
jgi:selenocysteine lyase/cysteine desulfurase